MKINILKIYQIALFILIIFANSYRIITTNFFQMYNVTTYIIAILFFGLFIKNMKHIKLNILNLTIFLFIVWIMVSTLVNDITQVTYAITICLVLFLFMVLLPYERINFSYIIKILKLYMTIGTIFSIVALFFNQKLLSYFFSIDVYGLKLYHTITGNKNADAAILFFSIISTYIIYKCTYKKLYILLLSVQIISLIIMFSRTPLFSLIIFYLVYVWFYLSGKRRIITSISLVTIGALLSTSSFFINIIIRPDAGLSGRTLIWNEAITISQNNLFWGIGFNNWNYWKNFSGETLFVHNTYLQTIIDLGLFGLIFYLIISLLVIKVSHDLIKKATNRLEKALTVGIFAANFSIIVYSFFEANFIGGYKGIELNSIVFFSLVFILNNNKDSYSFTHKYIDSN